MSDRYHCIKRSDGGWRVLRHDRLIKNGKDVDTPLATSGREDFAKLIVEALNRMDREKVLETNRES